MARTVKKVSLAIGREELAWAERRAKREKTSVSAVLTAAARRVRDDDMKRERQQRAWAEIVAWVAGEGGLSEEDLAAGRRILDGDE